MLRWRCAAWRTNRPGPGPCRAPPGYSRSMSADQCPLGVGHAKASAVQEAVAIAKRNTRKIKRDHSRLGGWKGVQHRLVPVGTISAQPRGFQGFRRITRQSEHFGLAFL